MRGLGVFFGNVADEGGGEVTEGVVIQSIRGGGADVGAHETGQDGRDEGADVGVYEEALVVEHRGGELHDLSEDEEVLEVVRDFFGDELHKVRDQLVQTWIGTEAGEGGDAVFVVRFVEECLADLLEVELEFFGENVLDLRFDADVVVAADGGEVGVCAGAFGDEVLISGVCGCGVLGYGGLDAFDC